MDSKSTIIKDRPDQGEVNITIVFKLKLGFVFLILFVYLEYFYFVNLLTMRG